MTKALCDNLAKFTCLNGAKPLTSDSQDAVKSISEKLLSDQLTVTTYAVAVTSENLICSSMELEVGR